MYETIPDFLARCSEKYGGRTALYIRRFLRTTKFSYKELEEYSLKIANYLIKIGLSKGDSVLIWAPNMPEWVLALFGALSAGVVVVPVGLHSTAEVVEKYIGQTKPKVLFLSKYFPIDLKRSENKKLRRIYLEDLLGLAEGSEPNKLPRIPRNELAEIVFTSGTTGEPKGVMISHHNILYEIEQLLKTVPAYSHYRLLSILPLSHVMEQIVGLIGPLARGATIYYIPRINEVTIRKALAKYRITDLGVVPQMLRMFLDQIELEASQEKREGIFDLALKISPLLPIRLRRILFGRIYQSLGGSLYVFGIGSAPLDLRLAKTWEALGVKVVEGYGASETTGGVTANRINHRKLGSVGKRLPGIEVTIAKDGEILAKGDNVTKGYFNNEEKTRESFTNEGLFKTGDVGYFDKDGWLYITGREKFKIVTAAGDKVYPEDVERKLNDHPAVWDSCVLGVKKGDGEIVYATIILRPGAKARLEEVVSQVNQRLETNQKILGFFLWPEKDFPRLHTLKVDRNKVREAIEARLQGKVAAAASNESRDQDALKNILAKVCQVPPAKIKEDTKLVSGLGLDSLKRVELVSLIEEEMGLEIDEEAVDSKTTVARLRQTIKGVRSHPRGKTFPLWPRHPLIVWARDILRRAILFPFQSWFVTKLTVEGQANLERLRSPAIFIFNHVGHYDSALVLRVLPERLRKTQFGLGDALLFEAPWRAFVMYLLGNAYPLNKFGGAVRSSLEETADLIDQGWSLVVAPEGQISPDGKLQKFKSGVATLAVEMGVPVVPIKIEGYRKIFPRIQQIGALEIPEGRGPVTVRVGQPVMFSQDTSYEKANKTLEEAMKKL